MKHNHTPVDPGLSKKAEIYSAVGSLAAGASSLYLGLQVGEPGYTRKEDIEHISFAIVSGVISAGGLFMASAMHHVRNCIRQVQQ